MEETKAQPKVSKLHFLFLAVSALGTVFCYDFMGFSTVLVALPAFIAAAALTGRFPAATFAMLGAFTVAYGLYLGYGILFCLRIILLALPAGALLFLGHKAKLGSTQATLLAAIAIAFGLYAVFCFNSLHAGNDAYAEVRALFSYAFSTIESTGLSLGSTVTESLNTFLEELPSLFPASLYTLGAFYALINVLLLQLLSGKKKRLPLLPMRPFGQWRLSRFYILGCVGVLTVSLIASYAGFTAAEALLMLIYNMLNLPLALVGAGQMYSLFTRSKKSPLRIVLFIGVLVLLSVTGFVSTVLSIFGFFACMSVRPRRSNPS